MTLKLGSVIGAALLAAGLVGAVQGEIIDRVAAVIVDDVITTSEIDQMILLRFVPRNEAEEARDHRRRVLDWMIAQALRYRDVARFGAEDVPADVIEARLQQVIGRFASPEDFRDALELAELQLDEVRALVKRQIQVEAYIEERFAPLIFVSLEEVENHYRDVFIPGRREQGLQGLPIEDVRAQIRSTLRAERIQAEIQRWTEELRERANVDVYAY